jgi:7,8-dihydropterin-6-yl-methyl-4-(beta-D-ribofuranosyl)aminobenzene 5'-phosphate synthase
VLLANLEVLGLDPGRLDHVVLSHFHADHTGGLADLLPRAGGFELICPGPLSVADVDHLGRRGVRIRAADQGPLEIAPRLWTTGAVGQMLPEQALVTETEAGLVVLTGCAHPGPMALVEAARGITDQSRVDLLAGGFHLLDHELSQVGPILAELRRMEVARIAPGHCTGERVMIEMARQWPENFVRFGCGQKIEL